MTGDGIATWVTFACMLPTVGVLALTTPLEFDQGDPWFRIVVSVSATAVALAALLIVWALLLRRLTGTARIVTTFIAYTAAGALKGLFQQWLLLLAGGGEWISEDVLSRMLTNCTQWPVVLGMISFTVGSTRGDYQRIKLLRAHQEVANQILLEARTNVVASQGHLVETVKETISQAAGELRLSSPNRVIADTQKFADDTVRPLSHRLSQEVPTWSMPSIDTTKIKLSWPRFFLDAPVTGRLSPLWTTAALGVFALGYVLSTRGPVGTVVTYAVMLPALFVLLYLAVGLSRAISATTRRGQLTVNITTMVVLGVFPFVITQYLADRGVFPMAVNSLSFLILGPAMFVLLAVGVACYEDQVRISRLTELLQHQLKWIQARISIERWARHGQIARALHGPYQAVIYAHILGLQKLLDSDALTQAEIPKLASSLDHDLEEALAADSEEQSLELALERIVAMWADLATVSSQVSPAAQSLIDPDPALSDLASSLLHDGIVNAIRHGTATQIDISIVSSTPDSIEISISDNGPTTPASQGSGLGSVQFDATTLEWELTSLATGHLLRLVLPCGMTIDEAITSQRDGVQELV